jgi:hypothetical protein
VATPPFPVFTVEPSLNSYADSVTVSSSSSSQQPCVSQPEQRVPSRGSARRWRASRARADALRGCFLADVVFVVRFFEVLRPVRLEPATRPTARVTCVPSASPPCRATRARPLDTSPSTLKIGANRGTKAARPCRGRRDRGPTAQLAEPRRGYRAALRASFFPQAALEMWRQRRRRL